MKKPYRFSHLAVLVIPIAVVLGCSNNKSDGTPPAPLPTLIAFVSSATGSGAIGTWSDAVSAGSVTGLVAGDAVCKARAQAAGLSGAFKAWLSDDSDDAYCRLHGLTGKRSANCGQANLPAWAGPWVRTDGAPFAEVISKLTTSLAILTPASIDENGVSISVPRYFSGTDSTGVAVVGGNCNGWIEGTVGNTTFGEGKQPVNIWAGSGTTGCSSSLRLLCFQVGQGAPLPYQMAGKRAFVTSVTGSGNLSTWPDAVISSVTKTGVAGGDAICQNRALASGLTGTFKAWLSDATVNAKDRLISNGPWIRIDGVKIADSKADLIDGELFTALVVNEYGYYATGSAWTGTNSAGTVSSNHCSGWTDSTTGAAGRMGYINLVGPEWTDWSNYSCDYAGFRLYCFED